MDRPADRPLVIGHRGMFHAQRQNTLNAYRGAFEAGCDAIECDIRLSHDGLLFVHHDRTVFPSGKRAEQMTQEERDARGVITIEQVFEMMEEYPGKGLVIESKTVAAAQALCARYEPQPLQLALSFSDRATQIALDHGWPSAYLQAEHPFIVLDCCPEGAYLAPEVRIAGALTDEDLARSSVWTVNDPQTAYRLAERGVYALTTDHPFGIFGAFAQR